MTGFETALSEITLVLFTTLAPAGVVAFVLMGMPLMCADVDSEKRARINKFLCIPLVTSMVGLVASATHLGNPANALYVFFGVGRSPLSTEVFSAVVFLAFAGLYWLYSFAEHPRVGLQRVWMALTSLAGVVFVTAVAYAYNADTIISWNTPYVPLALWLNALVGGPVLAVLSLRVADYDAVEGAWGRRLLMLSTVALLLNVGVYIVQALDLPTLVNSFSSAADLVPFNGMMIAAFAVLAAAGIALDAAAAWGRARFTLVRMIAATTLVLAGIFIMRFSFYMMHLTVGLSM